jgi:hypothetical protein
MNERMDEWMNEWTNERMDEWMNEWMNEWTNGWMNERMDEWMNEWMDGWMDDERVARPYEKTRMQPPAFASASFCSSRRKRKREEEEKKFGKPALKKYASRPKIQGAGNLRSSDHGRPKPPLTHNESTSISNTLANQLPANFLLPAAPSPTKSPARLPENCQKSSSPSSTRFLYLSPQRGDAWKETP